MTILRIRLLSNTCFASSSLTWMNDADICQDLDDLGLPKIPGRSLKGLLTEEASILLRAMKKDEKWVKICIDLFGSAGADDASLLRIADARIESSARQALVSCVDAGGSLQRLAARATTCLLSQTRIDPITGSAATGSLRTARVAMKGLQLEAEVSFNSKDLKKASEDHQAFFATAVSMVRRGGVHRNRGWGKLGCHVFEDGVDVTEKWCQPVLKILS